MMNNLVDVVTSTYVYIVCTEFCKHGVDGDCSSKFPDGCPLSNRFKKEIKKKLLDLVLED